MNPQTTKIVFIDIDGSLLPKSRMWEKLNDAFGLTPEEDQELFTRFKTEGISYNEWIAEINKKYAASGKATAENLKTVVAHATDQVDAKALETISTLKSRGYYTVLLSGTVGPVVEALATVLVVDEWHSVNKLNLDTVSNSYQIETLGNEKDQKFALAQEVIARVAAGGTPLVYCVGDGRNDELLFKTYTGITFPDTEMAKECLAKHVVVDFAAVTDVLV